MKLLSAIFLLGISSFAFSQNTISTEAPSISASSTTIGKNVFQIESSFNTGNSDGNGFYTTSQSFYNLLRLGLTDRIELRVSNGFFFNENPFGKYKGFDPIGLGVKYDFVKDPRKKTHFSLMAHFNIPEYEGNRQTGNINFSLSQELKTRHTIGCNLGYAINNYSTSNQNITYSAVNYSLIYNYQVLEKLTVFGEAYGNYYDNNQGFQTSDDISYDIGFMYLLKSHIQVDYVFGTGIDTDFNFHSVGFNIMLQDRRRRRSVPFI